MTVTEANDPIVTPDFAEDTAIDMQGRKISYGQLARRVASYVDVVLRRGISSGDRVMIRAEQPLETITVMLALWQIGAVAVPVNPKFPPARLEKMAQFIAPVIWWQAVSDDELTEAVPLQEQVISLESDATIIFTSGSSGEPKAALHTYGNHYYSALGSNDYIPLGPGDKWLLSLPLFHVGGIAILFRCFLAGATVVLPTNASLGKLLKAEGVTHLSCVPTQLIRLLAENEQFPELKALLLGGATIPQGLVSSALDRGIPVCQTYGCTEMSSQVCTGRELRNAGAPLRYREVSVSDDNEILVRGMTLFRGYVDGSDVKAAVDGKGWFHTGDLGYMEDGKLTVSGRKDNMFISGGENIQPEEIERALLAVSGIDEAIVVPKADNEFGMRPVAFLSGNWDEGHIRTELQKQLPSYMMPVAFREMPETTTLKPARADLAALLVQG